MIIPVGEHGEALVQRYSPPSVVAVTVDGQIMGEIWEGVSMPGLIGCYPSRSRLAAVDI